MTVVFILQKIVNQTMNAIAIKSLIICIVYGIMSICQTLNSRYLYRNLNFNFYSFIFGIQRIVIIALFFSQGRKHLNRKMLVKILPYSLFMCLSNILSSYCLTIMPLAGFLSFKKFIVLFVLAITVVLKLPVKTNKFQNICIVGIVIGGALVGQKDLLHGHAIGYASCLLFNLSQSIVLQYSAYLYRHDSLQPSQLLLYNCMIGFPYYLGLIAYEAEFDDIYYFFQDHFSFTLLAVLLCSIFLACCSELSSSYIAMKISPFEKSTVSNIKDLILMLISVFVYHDFSITPISGVGLILCLIFSALFSLPYLQHTNKTNEQQKEEERLQARGEQGTSLFNEENMKNGNERISENALLTRADSSLEMKDEIISEQNTTSP